MHRDPILEFEHDQTVGHDDAALDLHVHNVEEARLRPFAFFPMGNQLAVTKEIHWRLDIKVDRTKSELEIKLTHPYLGSELSDNRRQVKLLGKAIHSVV